MTADNRHHDSPEVEKAVPTAPTTTKYVPAQQLLRELLDISLVLPEEWDSLPQDTREQLNRETDLKKLLAQLVQYHLLTSFQAERVAAGRREGLILGNYRVLERLGAGGMGVVFKGEHLLMRRLAAIKVLPLHFEDSQLPLARFLGEIRTLAQLQHPNIVAALDAGKFFAPNEQTPNLYYFVMEFVPGIDLDLLVNRNGPLPLPKACDLVCQVASALAETHKHNLIHRDIKPSNILVTPEGQAKLLDFGLARHYHDRRVTEQGVILGTLDYMAPEQAGAAGKLDIRADLYSLAATLYWCLAATTPFPAKETLVQEMLQRQSQPPPSIRQHRPDVSAELDLLLQRMMALDPNDRLPNPQTFMRALLPFLQATSQERMAAITAPAAVPLGTLEADSMRGTRALVVDDDDHIRLLLHSLLEMENIACDEASDGQAGWEAAQGKPYDLVLLDIDMPRMTGAEVLKHLRENPSVPHQKIIMLSGGFSGDELAQLLAGGADDFLPKPLSLVQLKARLKSALARKDAEDRSDLLNRHLLAINSQLEQNLLANASDLVQARNALLLALAELVDCRTGKSSGHLLRMPRFVRCLAEQAAQFSIFKSLIDAPFIEMLECVAPLHDIGLVGLPDHILQNPGKYHDDDRLIMQTHTTLGADILQRIAQRHSSALAFLQMAIDVTRHHHERFDGSGYPDRLSGNSIPLAARLVALCDVYDALRCRRHHRPALSHSMAVQVMTAASVGHFDPHLLHIFENCAADFDRLFRDIPNT